MIESYKWTPKIHDFLSFYHCVISSSQVLRICKKSLGQNFKNVESVQIPICFKTGGKVNSSCLYLRCFEKIQLQLPNLTKFLGVFFLKLPYFLWLTYPSSGSGPQIILIFQDPINMPCNLPWRSPRTKALKKPAKKSFKITLWNGEGSINAIFLYSL